MRRAAVALLLLPACALAFVCAPRNSAAECTALGALYSATNGERWRSSTGWSSAAAGVATDYCTFVGVECGGEDGASVVKVKLALNELSGTLPDGLGALSAVEFLSLGFNAVAGPVPPSLGGLASLSTLNLRNNKLSGSLPAQLGSLSRLKQLEVGSNSFSGSVPSSFGNLSLTGFWLSRSALCGKLPPSLEERCSTGATWCPGFPLPAC